MAHEDALSRMDQLNMGDRVSSWWPGEVGYPVQEKGTQLISENELRPLFIVRALC